MQKILSLSFLCIVLLLSNSVCLAKTVVYNVKTQKYHSVNCQHASKCTKDCIKIDKKDAIKLGGVPCKTCSK